MITREQIELGFVQALLTPAHEALVQHRQRIEAGDELVHRSYINNTGRSREVVERIVQSEIDFMLRHIMRNYDRPEYASRLLVSSCAALESQVDEPMSGIGLWVCHSMVEPPTVTHEPSPVDQVLA